MEDADDAGGALVGGAAEAEPADQLGVGGGARHPDRAGVGHVGQQGAQDDDQLDVKVVGHADDLLGERAPLELGLVAEQHDHVAGRAGQRGP